MVRIRQLKHFVKVGFLLWLWLVKRRWLTADLCGHKSPTCGSLNWLCSVSERSVIISRIETWMGCECEDQSLIPGVQESPSPLFLFWMIYRDYLSFIIRVSSLIPGSGSFHSWYFSSTVFAVQQAFIKTCFMFIQSIFSTTVQHYLK